MATAHFKKGFTLVELIVSLGIFVIVVFIAVSSLLVLVDLDAKAQSLKSVVNNLNYALESMTREIRVGDNYPLSGEANSFEFTSAKGEQIKYELIVDANGNGQILRTVGGGSPVSFTAPEVHIDNSGVFLFKVSESNSWQPYVIIRLKGWAGITDATRTDFAIQTFVTQRSLISGN
jgi:prepilin-type N-terminal cleavage/methylation domain-containing protein